MLNRHWKLIAAVSVLMILLSGSAMASKHNIHFGHRGIQGSGDMETREIDLDDFNEVSLRGGFDVDITFGKRQQVKITIDDNLWDILEAEVDDDVLILGWEENCRPDGDCKVEIVVKSLEAFQLSGAGDISISDFDGPSFTFDLSGAGDVTMDGQVKDLDIHLSGAGNVDTRALKAENVEVSISGAGNADVYASESLRGRVSGVGNLDYYGDPKEKKTKVSGIGRISQK